MSCTTFTPTLDSYNNLYYENNYSMYTNNCSLVAVDDAASQYELFTIYKNGLSGQVALPKANHYLRAKEINYKPSRQPRLPQGLLALFLYSGYSYRAQFPSSFESLHQD